MSFEFEIQPNSVRVIAHIAQPSPVFGSKFSLNQKLDWFIVVHCTCLRSIIPYSEWMQAWEITWSDLRINRYKRSCKRLLARFVHLMLHQIVCVRVSDKFITGTVKLWSPFGEELSTSNVCIAFCAVIFCVNLVENFRDRKVNWLVNFAWVFE